MNRQDHGTFKVAMKQDAVQVGTRELKEYTGAVLQLIAVLEVYGNLNLSWPDIKRLSDKIDRKYNRMNESIAELALSSRRSEREVNS